MATTEKVVGTSSGRVKGKSNSVTKDLRLVVSNLKSLERSYISVVKEKDGAFFVPAGSVMTLENKVVYVTEALTEFLDAIKRQAK